MRPTWIVLVGSLAACKSSSTGTVDAPGAAEEFRALAMQPLTVDATGLTPIIYGKPLFDGSRLWVTYNRSDGNTALDVYLTAFAGDGSLAVPPTQLDQSNDNEIQPSIALSGATLMVAWAADTGVQPTNLHTRVRLVDLNGVAQGSVLPIVPTRNGVPNVTNNIWQASVASDTNGFVLFGTWGIDEAPAFQGYAARLDIDGALVGDAIELGTDAAVTQDAPSGLVLNGTIRAAWENEQNVGTAIDVRTTSIAAGATTAAVPTTLANGAGSPSLSANGAHVWGAWTTAPTGVDANLLDSTTAATHIDGAISPAVAADTVGAAVAYYAGTTLRVTRLDANGARSSDIEVAEKVLTSYPIGFTRIADGLFCVTWADGNSPALASHAMVIDLATP